MGKYKNKSEKRRDDRIKGFDALKNKGGYHKPGSLKKVN
jgi:hypothetical protein